MSSQRTAMPCPCGRGRGYDQCCGPVHAGSPAATAEALMRSRYSAFVMRDTGYLLRTWHVSTRPARLSDPGREWTGLEIVDTTAGGLFDRTGTVRFNAHYRDGGQPGIQSENSRFVREGRQWFYVDAAE
ncbi:MAG: YchJ family protein [Stackebrandtia sp.]